MVWWLVNARRTKGQDVIPIQDFDPMLMLESLKQESSKETASKSDIELSAERKRELRKKLDAAHYKEYYQKQNQN